MTEELKDMSKLQIKVFMLLPEGIDNLISVQEIMDILEINDRTTMSIIEILIMKFGIPIGSLRQANNFGYFIATNEAEKRMGVYSNEQQVKTMKKRITRVKEADLNTAVLYKEKYKDAIINQDKQSNIYEYIKAANEEALSIEDTEQQAAQA